MSVLFEWWRVNAGLTASKMKDPRSTRLQTPSKSMDVSSRPNIDRQTKTWEPGQPSGFSLFPSIFLSGTQINITFGIGPIPAIRLPACVKPTPKAPVSAAALGFAPRSRSVTRARGLVSSIHVGYPKSSSRLWLEQVGPRFYSGSSILVGEPSPKKG